MTSADTWINYHHLYYFKVIATEGSISKAAQKLRLGQPTLSAQLKQFEERIEVQLFERKHKRLVLTEAGRVALEYANEIFTMGSEMIEVLHDRLVPNRVHVQVGALDSVPKDLLLSLTQAALRRKDCSISILEGKGDELVRELLAHRIDLVLANHTPALSQLKGLYSKTLARLPILICGAPKFKALRKGFPESLRQQPFVLPTVHSRLRHDLDHYFRVNQIHIDLVAETQDTSIQKLLGQDGVGLIPATELAVSEALRRGELIELGRLDGVSEEIFLIAASRRIENPVSAHLMKTFSL